MKNQNPTRRRFTVWLSLASITLVAAIGTVIFQSQAPESASSPNDSALQTPERKAGSLGESAEGTSKTTAWLGALQDAINGLVNGGNSSNSFANTPRVGQSANSARTGGRRAVLALKGTPD
ncbi:MAG: hypothetical protein EBR81_00840 [Proteobacteria bacterium]|nr:hypothetical protein [Pseudomonadota bacterium]